MIRFWFPVRAGSQCSTRQKSLTKLANRLTTLAGTSKKIFFSIGSAPDPNHPERIGDFGTVKELYSTPEGQNLLQNNFGALLEGLSMVTGFDFDVEECWDVPSTAWLTALLATKFKTKPAITYCPFGDKEWWEQCLESVYQALKTQPVMGLNLQCYSGGSNEDPGEWADYIKANGKKNGVADPSSFIVPGYAANNTANDGPGICPDQFTTNLTPYKGKVGGAFVWNSQHIFDDAAPCNGKTPTIAQTPADLESTIRAELHIPKNAQHVLILSMDAHMDWDWQVTFQDYLKGPTPDSPVTEIIGEAFSYLKKSKTAPFYYYSICEMGYLQGAVQIDPSLTQNFQTDIGDRLRIVGGGVTSPDNLLPHGETTIRNYLVGKTWMQKTFGLPLRQAYVPDDFGHDSQFPVLLAAMGLMGVSFSRIPGSVNQGPAAEPILGGQSLSDQLVQNGVDFVWQAADGSTVIAHFMQQHYNQGHGINADDDPDTKIKQYISTNEPSAPTPYMYVPCGDDFAMPDSVGDLVATATNWNSTNFKGNADDVYVVVATLDHYLQLISTYVDPSVKHGYGPYKNLGSMPFFATPYWTGYYASRIENKILHQAATRALLGAETFGAVADLLENPDAFGFQWLAQGRRGAIWNGWQALVPSTHHDYISGTASDAVSTTEQVPLLAGTLALGEGASASAIEQIARQVQATPNAGEIPVAIFNQLGFQANGPCALPPLPGFVPQSIRFEDSSQSAVQITHDGQYLFLATAPSLGYQAGYLSAAQVTPPEPATISSPVTGTWFLSNGVLTANITSLENWAIASLVVNGDNLFSYGGNGNDLQFYIDKGGIYRFGNEYNQDASNFVIDPNGTLTPGPFEVLEEGPLRVWLRTTTYFKSIGTDITGTYIRDYILVAGEPFLRMSFSGAAPLTAGGQPTTDDPWSGHPYAVMVRFPFAQPGGKNLIRVDKLTYGTPYHWVTQMPVAYWQGPTFQAMHDYLLLQAKGSVLAAIYQSSIPAWAVDDAGAMIGCVVRNSPSTPPGFGYGQNGQDTETHAHHYAIRVPSGIEDPKTGAQLQESRILTTPLRAAYVTVPVVDSAAVAQFPKCFSLASVTPSSAIITAAKPGTLDSSSLIFRLYQPTNQPLAVSVTLAPQITNNSGVTAELVTALEDSISGSPPLSLDGLSISFTVPLALATLRVGPPAPS
jgi:alpha-mannosidase